MVSSEETPSKLLKPSPAPTVKVAAPPTAVIVGFEAVYVKFSAVPSVAVAAFLGSGATWLALSPGPGDADMVVVFEHGRVAEQGGYQELIDHGGAFSRLVSTQQAGIESA